MLRYKHYKGGIYTYLYAANHTETEELLVIYQGEDKRIWARPYEMFFGYTDDGIIRFELIDG